ncbi:MAG TPA: FIST N-terminal domain-containing protein [Candidatus Binataceae bacterium]|nr:FIST N-terminal domain-containing protein [Candidatus Binataceae bacterium]
MLRAGVGHSIALNPRTAAREATAQALTAAGLSQASGALVFATTAYGAAYAMILREVGATAKTREVAGCSSVGVIACEHEIESGPALAVMVFGGADLVAQRCFAPQLRGRADEVAAEVAHAVRPALGKSNLLLVFPDSYNANPGALVAALARELPEVAVCGGGASEDGSVGETFQFCGDVVANNSVSGMLLAGDFDLKIVASNACTPIGAPHRVTAARDNVILTLDDRPAYEVFAAAAGSLAKDLRRALAFVFLAIKLDYATGEFSRGGYLVRNIIGASEEHGVIAVAHTPRVGEMVALALRDADRARADLKATLEETLAQTRAAGAAAPAFGLYFDCVSRGAGLYNIPGHDAAYIRRYLGNFPLAGFFTGFEIGPAGATTAALQYSGVLAIVSPK